MAKDLGMLPSVHRWFVLLLAAALPVAAGPKWLTLGPMLGDVTEQGAQVWVKSSAPARWSIQISERSDLSRSRTVKGSPLQVAHGLAGSLRIGGLSPSHTYFYTVLLDGQEVTHPPYASFTSAPLPGTPGRYRFGFISCSGYEPHEPAAGWADMGARTNMDLILMMGDNHYANTSNLEKQRAAYLGQRSSPGFLATTQRLPVYGIWDDHDFGPNDSDSTMPGKEEALAAFKEHWANPAYGEATNPGVYFKFSRGDVDFYCLDGRYYRSPNKMPDQPGKTMLGRAQLEWLKSSLSQSKARLKVLVSGGEWQSYGTADSWTSFLREREEIFQFIDSNRITGVILVSGDRHFTAAYQVKGRFLEVTSGPIGGNSSNSRVTPEMIINHNQGRFYCVYGIDTTQPEPSLTLEIYQVGIGLVKNRTFSWDEVNGRVKIATLPVLPPAPAP
jgi:alkaline phosphatase D